MFSESFFTDENLKKLQSIFFNQWDYLNLKPNLKAPKGTHESKIDLVKEIYINAPIPTLEKYTRELKEGTITIKIHRKIRMSFINNLAIIYWLDQLARSSPSPTIVNLCIDEMAPSSSVKISISFNELAEKIF